MVKDDFDCVEADEVKEPEEDLGRDETDEDKDPEDAFDLDETNEDKDPEAEAVVDALGVIVEGLLWMLGLV